MPLPDEHVAVIVAAFFRKPGQAPVAGTDLVWFAVLVGGVQVDRANGRAQVNVRFLVHDTSITPDLLTDRLRVGLPIAAAS